MDKWINQTMIPDFNDHGYLPPGVHQATLNEIAATFGQASELRRVQMQSLRWLIDLARQAGIERLVIDGSFVTEKLEPNDVDCVLLMGDNYPEDALADAELAVGLPFLTIEVVHPEEFRFLITEVFASDRELVPKGMIEVIV